MTTDNKVKTTDINNPIIVPCDPNNVNALTWFSGDAQNLRTWCGLLFNGSVDISDPNIQNIKAAALAFLGQLQDDINTINEILKKY